MFTPANNILQTENTDLSTERTLVAARFENVHNLRTEEKFCDIWDKVVTQTDGHSRQTRRDITLLQDHVVEETTRNNEINTDEMRRSFYSTLDQVINEMDVRFSHQNTKLYAAVSALQPENSNFDCTSKEAEFDVANTYVAKLNGDEKTNRQQPNSFLNIVKHL